MLPLVLANTTRADVYRLVENRVTESLTIDFKEMLKVDRDKEKTSFLADVSAFANAGGGDLVFGVKEDQGAAYEVAGIEVTNLDKEILRLNDLMRDSIDPPLTNADHKWIEIEGGKWVLIIRIPRSFI
jgi:predicted HTH transcriptional regulator